MEGSISVLDVGRQVCALLLCEEGIVPWGRGFGEPANCGHLKPVLVCRPPCGHSRWEPAPGAEQGGGCGGSPSPSPWAVCGVKGDPDCPLTLTPLLLCRLTERFRQRRTGNLSSCRTIGRKCATWSAAFTARRGPRWPTTKTRVSCPTRRG